MKLTDVSWLRQRLGMLVLTAGAFAAGWYLKPLPGLSGGTSAETASGPASPSARAAATAGTRNPADGKPPSAAAGPQRPFPRGGAADWIASQSYVRGQDPLGKRELLHSFLSLDEKDFAAIHEALLAEVDQPTGSEASKAVIQLANLTLPEWARLDPSGALNAALAMPGGILQPETCTAVFFAMAKLDPEAAATALGQLPVERQPDAGHGILTALARKDPFAALEWIPRLGKAAIKFPREIVDAAVRIDPPRAAALAGALSGEEFQGKTFVRTMEQWTEQQPAAAAAWIQSYDGPNRAVGLMPVLRQMNRTNPELAAALFMCQPDLPDSTYIEAAVATIAASLAQKNLTAAVAWMNRLHRPGQQAAAVSELMGTWIQQDSEAASLWVNQQPQGEVRDAAARALIHEIKESSPSDAWAWASSLHSPSLRKQTQDEVMQAWHQANPAAAQAILETGVAPPPSAVEGLGTAR